MKARIIENTLPSGRKSYTIQQRHFLFRWWWVPAWVNSMDGAACCDTWGTLHEARENLCWFDGTETKRRIISLNEHPPKPATKPTSSIPQLPDNEMIVEASQREASSTKTQKTNTQSVSCQMLRLVRSIKSLGFINGFRYWKIENALMRDPDRALVWALDIEAESILEGLRGNLLLSQDLMKFAAEIRKAHSEYILANTEN